MCWPVSSTSCCRDAEEWSHGRCLVEAAAVHAEQEAAQRPPEGGATREGRSTPEGGATKCSASDWRARLRLQSVVDKNSAGPAGQQEEPEAGGDQVHGEGGERAPCGGAAMGAGGLRIGGAAARALPS